MLDEIADSMPYELYRDLSGGMRLLVQSKLHPKAVNNDLYILGEYHRDVLGQYIVFYYGSFIKAYGGLPRDKFYEMLRRTLAHEVRHHNEYLAGCDDLNLYDDKRIGDYLIRKGK